MTSPTIVALGGAVAALATLHPNPRRSAQLMAGGGAVALYGLFAGGSPADELGAAQQEAFDVLQSAETARGVGDLFASGDTELAAGTAIERTLATIPRVVASIPGVPTLLELAGVELPADEPFVTVRAGRPAAPGAQLGKPRNLYRIAGAITSPTDGAHVDPAFGGKTLGVFGAIENQSNELVEGTLELHTTEEVVFKSAQSETISGTAPITLAPGAFLEVVGRVPRLLVTGFGINIHTTVRLMFRGYLLAQVSFTR